MQRMLALLLLVASVPAGADIYKWTDENGRVHFGDSAAGAGRKAEAVAPAPGSTPRAATASGPKKEAGTTPDAGQMKERQRRLLDTFQREQAEREAAARQQSGIDSRQAADCQRLRDELEEMDGRVVYITGDDGERQYLDEAQRKDYVDRANRHLEEHCR